MKLCVIMFALRQTVYSLQTAALLIVDCAMPPSTARYLEVQDLIEAKVLSLFI